MALEPIGDQVHAFWVQPAAREEGFERGEISGTIISPDTAVTSTPVSAFNAAVADRTVFLRWSVISEAGIRGFRLHRADGASSEFVPLGTAWIPTGARDDYELRDTSVIRGESYRYRLEVGREEGSLWHGPVTVRVPAAKLSLNWHGALPNPFREAVSLRLECSRAATGTIVIYDVAGHEVSRLHEGRLAIGINDLRWDGRDRKGRAVQAGIYLVRARVEGVAVTARLARVY